MFTRKLSFTKPKYPKARAMGITAFPYREYDSNDNVIYYESADGYWIKTECNKGYCTYWENSNGKIVI
jgi:hypothetical protein